MEASKGRFMLFGGGPAARTPGEVLLPRLVHEAGGAGARVTIITAGTELPNEVNGDYWDILTGLGVTDLFSPKILSREDADAPWVAEGIASSNVVFIAGGSQAKLEDRLVGTAAGAAMIDLWRRGGILSGTSSGASLFSDLMVLDGGTLNPHLRRDMIRVGRGFGILPGTVIDTHCSSRGRIPRLVSLLIAHPELLVIGMDEDSAMLIEPDGQTEVFGYHAIYVLDGSGLRPAHAHPTVGDDHLCAAGMTLHCLTPGDRFDFASRSCPR